MSVCNLGLAAVLLCCVAATDDWGATSVTNLLNAQIAKGHSGVYTGGKGVIVRNPFDGYSDDTSKKVLPASFWVNDIFSVSQLYPGGDPRKPMADGQEDPWEYAPMCFVVGSQMHNLFPDFDNIQEPSWGYGVFYPYDSNSVDQRCRWLPDKNLYDCPGGIIPWGGKFVKKDADKGPAGYPAGNPNINSENGGGTGCHWDGAHNDPVMNQFDGSDGTKSLLSNSHCECSYAYKKESYHPTENGWDAWVMQMHTVAMGGFTVFSDFGDLSACWMNNPRDMINLQNQLYWARATWNDGKQPLTDFYNSKDYVHWRRYWGWNEVPVDHNAIQNPTNWDALVIYLPAGICSDGTDTPVCLSSKAQGGLQNSLEQWKDKGWLVPGFDNAGKRPGSYVVFVRQRLDSTGNYQQEFFCQSWAPQGGKYRVQWMPISKHSSRGACWVEYAALEKNEEPHASVLPILQDSTDQTSVTEMLNHNIRVGSCYGCYNGGRGVIVRNPFDGYEDRTEWQVVPTSFISNDIVAPTSIFPTGWNGWAKGNGNPDCPNDKTNGYKPMDQCPTDPRTGESGPWNYATTAYVIGSEHSLEQVFKDFNGIQNTSWGWGVFYPTDSNSVDGRCKWEDSWQGYNCPGGYIPWAGTYTADPSKQGSGSYPAGNPDADKNWGGGTGCHFSAGDNIIDQTPVDEPGVSLTRDRNCQCNYIFKDDWGHWVQTWMGHAHNYRKQDGWFAGGKAPGHALDQAACWMNNPRDMINLQNKLWEYRYSWANQISPKSAWDNTNSESLRVYWGWNEVPISRLTARNEQLRDAVVVKLPAGICKGSGGDDSLSCLGKGQGENLEGDFDLWINNGIMKTGQDAVSQRPGSYIVIMREYMHSISGWTGPDNWSRYFFCENWQSPSGKYRIVFMPKSTLLPYGACYLDVGKRSEQDSLYV